MVNDFDIFAVSEHSLFEEQLEIFGCCTDLSYKWTTVSPKDNLPILSGKPAHGGVALFWKISIDDLVTPLGPVHMIPGQLIAPGQLTDPWVNFASVHGLTPVTVHMSFSLPRGNFERWATRCTTPGNPPCRGNFSPCEQNAKVAPGQE